MHCSLDHFLRPPRADGTLADLHGGSRACDRHPATRAAGRRLYLACRYAVA